jgi:hypothetical protein
MDEKFYKVKFALDAADWHGRAEEELWADPAGDRNDSYYVRSTPFFTKLVSRMDIVRAVRADDGFGLVFSGVQAYGGHSTYMILVEPQSSAFDEPWRKLLDLRCQCEATKIETSEGERILFSLDVSPDVDVDRVYEVLEDAEHAGIWIFQEGHVGHPIRPRA